MKHLFFYFVLLLICTHNVVVAQIPSKITGNQYVKIETNLGEMIFLLSDQTPKHTANFVKLAKSGYFNRYDFNRVISGFVAQGGETDSAYAAMEKERKILERLAPEFNASLFHQKGALAAGRDDNQEMSSFLGQFYVVGGKIQTDASLAAVEQRRGGGFKIPVEARKIYKEVGGVPYLDQNYTVFGQLIKGMDVLEKIMGQATDKSDRPKVKVAFKVSVLSKKQIAKLETK